MKDCDHAIDPKLGKRSGFALIAALAVMSFMVMIAISLFTLSSVNVAVSTQSLAQTKAQANAKMALMIAIGELQKNVGPDRAITATSEILATSSTPASKPNITGAWEPWWDFDPTVAPDYNTEKTDHFRRWLVSSADETLVQSPDFVNNPWTGRTIELVGNGTLGYTGSGTDAPDTDKVTAGVVPISDGGTNKGSYAWHVADESVKARVNLYRDPDQNTTLAKKRALAAGHRPDASLIKDAVGDLLTFLPNDLTHAEYVEAQSSKGKMINLAQTELLDDAEGKIKPLRNDITLYSFGVMSNVRDGGLKLDLSSAFEMGDATTNTLPPAFTNETLYDSTHGITGISDPKWSALAGYYNSFRNLTDPDTNPTYTLQAGAASLDPVPDGFNPAPVIAKVDTTFSIIGRPLDNIATSNISEWVKPHFDLILNLVITPTIVLHNPYNVSVSFYKIEVTYSNIPIAFNFMFRSAENPNFISQSFIDGEFDSPNTMLEVYKWRSAKVFSLTIANWSNDERLADNDDIDGPITLQPGQTLICAPTFPPLASFDSDTRSGRSVYAYIWNNDLTLDIKAKPTYTPGLGFEIAHTVPGHQKTSRAEANGPVFATHPVRTDWVLRPGAWPGKPYFLLRGARADPVTGDTLEADRFYVEFKAQIPGWYSS